MKIYDLAIIGMGSMGMATAYYASQRGVSVLGIEQFVTPHNKGSHNGQSRIIRKAYFEHPNYVPILDKAYKNWEALEALTEQKLFFKTGLQYMGLPTNEIMKGVRYSADKHHISIEEKAMSSAFTMPDDFEYLYEANAGFVMPELTISTFKKLALNNGIQLEENTNFLGYKLSDKVVEIKTNKGSFFANKLLLTVGAGIKEVLAKYSQNFKITQQAIAWIDIKNPSSYFLENFPCWNIALPDGEGLFYGFPYLKNDIVKQYGLKLAHHLPTEEIKLGTRNPSISEAQHHKILELVDTYFDFEEYKILKTCTCLYTNSPDYHFVIDHLPDHKEKVIIAAGFSGHGFKFVPGIGELLADMALENKKDPHLNFLSLDRLENLGKDPG